MAKQTNRDNENNRAWIESTNSILNRENQFGFNWYAVPQESVPEGQAPRMFAFSWKSPAQHLIGCSTEVPEEFRRYWVIHEFLEESKPEYREKCLDTLKEELTLIPDVLTEQYIPIRAEFFRGMVEYAKNAKEPSPEFIAQLTLSRDYLNQLERRLKKNQNGNK